MAQKVKGSAFHFGDEVNFDGARIPDYFRWLISQSGSDGWPYGVEHEFSGGGQPETQQQLYTAESASGWCGVLLSSRTNINQHFKETDDQGNTVIVARPIEGVPPVELNFFSIRKDTRNGLYSHYRGSCSFKSFLYELWRSYTAFAEATLAAADNPPRKSTRGLNHTCPLFNRRGFLRLVAQLDKVHEVRLTTYAAETEEDVPVGDVLESQHVIYRLQPTAPDKTIRKWLRKKWLQSARPLKNGRTGRHTGAVVGTLADDDGITTVDFERTLDDLLEMTHDQIGQVNVNDLWGHRVISTMTNRITSDILFTIR